MENNKNKEKRVFDFIAILSCMVLGILFLLSGISGLIQKNWNGLVGIIGGIVLLILGIALSPNLSKIVSNTKLYKILKSEKSQKIIFWTIGILFTLLLIFVFLSFTVTYWKFLLIFVAIIIALLFIGLIILCLFSVYEYASSKFLLLLILIILLIILSVMIF